MNFTSLSTIFLHKMPFFLDYNLIGKLYTVTDCVNTLFVNTHKKHKRFKEYKTFFNFVMNYILKFMTNFLAIEQIFPDIKINLRVLSRGTERYSIALYQHEGVLDLTEQDSKLGNHDNPSSKFQSFINLVNERNVDLAMTPEYSCPWEVISSILDDNQRWPNDGKLWALGAESITPGQVAAFADLYDREDIKVYFDRARLNENGTFFDPLVYLFRATTNDRPHLVVLIQFKTHHMGVWGGGELERNRLIEGREIYIIRNNDNSVHLLTVICSEAMNFPQMMNGQRRAALRWDDQPFLILNPQVNPDPLHQQFIAFHNFVLDQDRKEIISLNWNLNSKIGRNELLRNGTSRSGVYMISTEINFGDKARIRSNHKLGMYYFYLDRNRHAFVLNSKPHAYFIEQLAVHISEGVQQQRMRNGPELIASYSHQADGTLVLNQGVSDNHLDYLIAFGCVNAFLANADYCILDKERLACLSAGEFLSKASDTWFSVEKLFSFRLDNSTEINNRITYTEDTGTKNQLYRQHCLTAIRELDGHILPDKKLYPDSIADLRAYEVLLAYGKADGVTEKEKYRHNLVDKDGNVVRATICYLGSVSLKTATETFEFIQSMYDTDSMNRQRVVVFYKDGQDYAVIADNYAGRIVITEEKDPSSFLND